MLKRVTKLILEESIYWFNLNVKEEHLRGSFNEELYKEYLLNRDATND